MVIKVEAVIGNAEVSFTGRTIFQRRSGDSHCPVPGFNYSPQPEIGYPSKVRDYLASTREFVSDRGSYIEIRTTHGNVYRKEIEEQGKGLLRWRMEQRGGMVYVAEDRGYTALWFSAPEDGKSMCYAFPYFTNFFYPDTYFIPTIGRNGERQYFLGVNRNGGQNLHPGNKLYDHPNIGGVMYFY